MNLSVSYAKLSYSVSSFFLSCSLYTHNDTRSCPHDPTVHLMFSNLVRQQTLTHTHPPILFSFKQCPPALPRLLCLSFLLAPFTFLLYIRHLILSLSFSLSFSHPFVKFPLHHETVLPPKTQNLCVEKSALIDRII